MIKPQQTNLITYKWILQLPARWSPHTATHSSTGGANQCKQGTAKQCGKPRGGCGQREPSDERAGRDGGRWWWWGPWAARLAGLRLHVQQIPRARQHRLLLLKLHTILGCLCFLLSCIFVSMIKCMYVLLCNNCKDLISLKGYMCGHVGPTVRRFAYLKM